jgi:hypothetical protein
MFFVSFSSRFFNYSISFSLVYLQFCLTYLLFCVLRSDRYDSQAIFSQHVY